MKTISNNIGIIGSGVVGSATGIGFASLGNNVTFFDIDENKIEDLAKKGFMATTDMGLMVKNCNIFFVCVPTPDKNGEIDLDIMKSVIEKLSILCRNKDDYFLIVIKSTITPTTTENIMIPLIQRFTNKYVGDDFGICFNPEFLRDLKAYEDFIMPDRVVIGEYDKQSGDMLEKLYSSLNCPIIRSNIRTAEMAKYANNCFYATKISFFNEIHMMCQEIGSIDSNVIRKIVQMDKFYGSHPWEHGHSFGGKCLPKDLNAVIALFNKGIHDPILLKAVRDINNKMENKEK
jgi:UDPglucose 6-dehydrogenase